MNCPKIHQILPTLSKALQYKHIREITYGEKQNQFDFLNCVSLF